LAALSSVHGKKKKQGKSVQQLKLLPTQLQSTPEALKRLRAVQKQKVRHRAETHSVQQPMQLAHVAQSLQLVSVNLKQLVQKAMSLSD
jgi:hypothetical protein